MIAEKLSVSIAPTTDLRAARCQLEVAVSRTLRQRGADPSEYIFPEPNDGLCSRAMSGHLVTVEVFRG